MLPSSAERPNQRTRARGWRVLSLRRHFVAALLVASNHAALLEMAQAIGQEVRGYAGKPFFQLAVATGPEEQLADDEQGSAVTHDVERSGHCAVLATGPHPPHHDKCLTISR